MALRRQPPQFKGDLKQWATDLIEYLEAYTDIQTEVQPQAVLLAHQLGGQLYRAITDGLLMYDPSQSAVVCSVAGQWVALEAGSGGGVTTFIGLSDTPAGYGVAGQLVSTNGGALVYVDPPTGGGISEAPVNNHDYARKNAAWSRAAVEPHSAAATYAEDDLVSYAGDIYTCVLAHSGQVFDLQYWRPIAPSSGTALSLTYEWSTSITGNPGAGAFAVNAADLTNATLARMSVLTLFNNDIGSIIGTFDVGDFLLYQESVGNNESVLLQVTAPGTLISGTPDYYDIPVVAVRVQGTPEDNRDGTVSYIRNPNNKLPAGGAANQLLRKIDAANFNTEWSDQFLASVHCTVVTGNDPTLANAQNVSAVAHVTDADYTITFGTALADANYHADVVPVGLSTDTIIASIHTVTSAGFSVRFDQPAYGGPQASAPLTFSVRVT